MKAIVGLGNPGAEYVATRHNVGFEVVDELARRWQVKLKKWRKVGTLALAKDHDALLMEPATFMNLSGEAVLSVGSFYKVNLADWLIVVDDVNLPLGRVRMRKMGSAGGHNGLKSVIQHLGPDFARLRIGVGRGDPKWDLADHVLARFEPEERRSVEEAIGRAADAVETFVTEGIEPAMNRFNARDDKATVE
jgi:peptidyl-tRNA hydrolase, PTH1 family